MAGKRLARNKGRSILYKWDGKLPVATIVSNEEEGRTSQAYLYKTGERMKGRRMSDENCSSLYMRGLKN